MNGRYFLALSSTLIGFLIVGRGQAALVSQISVKAMPTEYDGACPVSIQLVGTITSDLRFDQKLRIHYRWESNDGVMGDDVIAILKGKHVDVGTGWQIQRPAGTTLVQTIRLHVFLGYRNGRPDGEYFSTPVKISITCR